MIPLLLLKKDYRWSNMNDGTVSTAFIEELPKGGKDQS